MAEIFPNEELDGGGLPAHLIMGLTRDGHGPCEPTEAEFDHWGCWCGDKTCTKWFADAAISQSKGFL